MIKRPTWILLIVLILAIGSYFLIKNRPVSKSESTPTASGSSFLVNQNDGALQSLRISGTNGATFQMQRDLSQTWVITLPKNGKADQSLAGAAETQVGALRIITTLETSPDPSAIGLTPPSSTMELSFVNGKTHKIEVGNLTPTGSGYYVRFDTEKIYVVSQSGIDSLLNLLTAPPYPATETPPSTEITTADPTNEIATATP